MARKKRTLISGKIRGKNRKESENRNNTEALISIGKKRMRAARKAIDNPNPVSSIRMKSSKVRKIIRMDNTSGGTPIF
jgi:hypothetical protein